MFLASISLFGYMSWTDLSCLRLSSVLAFGIYDVRFQGKYVTSRNLRDRLYRELERNLAMRVEEGETADTFIVSGRGTLHITILIENM
ncbi:hypothetical protein U1Q18_040429 [Sarracenia purpurea var. burkii]